MSTSRNQNCRPISRLQRAASGQTCPNLNINKVFKADFLSKIGLVYYIEQEGKGASHTSTTTLQAWHYQSNDSIAGACSTATKDAKQLLQLYHQFN
eukprot:818225-Ditylum_brightwellii.AAC.3